MARITTKGLQALTAGAAGVLMAGGMGQSLQAADRTDRPNVILVMADDMGWGDAGFRGHPELQTPNLDAMAAAGMVLDRFYAAAPVCSPTRAAFLTGRHPRRMHVDNANNGHLPNGEITIAELAASQGYTTAHFGKWHLGTLTKMRTDANRGRRGNHEDYSPPWEHGFDQVFSTESKVPTYNPYEKPAENKRGFYGTWYWTGPEQPVDNSPQMQGDDSRLLMDRTLRFISDAHADGQPFLAVTWFHAPHAPVVLNPEYPYGEVENDLSRQAYYSCITAMDQEMGRLRQHLRELGIEDNTLILFTSDNGPEHRFGRKENAPTIGPDGSAGPFRGAKTDLWQGGLRVPCLIEWPGHITPGTSDLPAVTSDILPTLLDVWGISMPDNRPLDGESLIPVLRGQPHQRQQPIAFHYAKKRSLVDDQYKLISTDNGSTWELYDLINDPSETKDLAADQADRVVEMQTRWQQWFDQTEASRTGADYRTGVTEAHGVTIRMDKPASLEPGQQESSQPLLFVEKQYHTLRDNLPFDANDNAAASVAPGTLVHSYLLHIDGPQSAAQAAPGRITFDNPIIGVIADTQRLAASDFLSFGAPMFGDAEHRKPVDGWTISDDRRTLTVNVAGEDGTVLQLRILTAAGLTVDDDRSSAEVRQGPRPIALSAKTHE